jgi:hypothetical protein
MDEKTTKPQRDEIELRPDGWERFEKAIDVAVKAGPKHRTAPKAKERPPSEGRVRKGKSPA